MEYKNEKELIKNLKNEELKILENKASERKDKKTCREIALEMKKKGIATDKIPSKDKCLDCGMNLSECPIKEEIEKESRKE